MTLGAYPAVGLAKAREMHARAKEDYARGFDPGAEAMALRAKRKAAPTFKDMLDEFWEIELQFKKSGEQTWYILAANALPAWNKRKVADIKRRDIVLLLDKIRPRAPIVANRVHGALSRLFNFAAERGVIDDSPCTRIKKPPEKGRSRVLSDDEINALWKALDIENNDVDIYKPTKLALKMILLTGQRPGEVAGMTHSEIDEDGFWNIPAERMKNGEANRVPLCAIALSVVEQAKPFSVGSDFVFRSSVDKAGRDMPITRHGLTRAVARHWSELKFAERFTPHDLRRTVRTRLAELGVNDIVAERILGHKLQGMMAVYNRHAYDVEKRQALTLWEQRLKEILGYVKPVVKVIPFEVRHG
jgi:integrase